MYLQAWKRSYSARLPQFSTWATSKTKQFFETPSILEHGNVKNEEILRDFSSFRSWRHQKRSNSARLPSKMESWVQRWRLHVPRKSEVVFFHCFVAPEGRKVGSLKQRVRSHLARWEMNNCTPLWREARFELKTVKTIGFDVEKVHAIVARSTFRSQNAKTHHARSTFGSWVVEKVHAVVARSTFRSQNAKNITCLDHFWTLKHRFVLQAQGILPKVSKTWRFL